MKQKSSWFLLFFLLLTMSISGQNSKKDSLLAKINLTSEPLLKSEQILNFVDLYNDNSDTINRLLETALELSQENNLDIQEVKVLSTMGFNALSRGDYVEAQEHYHQSALLALATGDSLEYYWAQHSLGLVNFYLKNFDTAEEIYLDNMDYLKRIKDTAALAGLYNNLGMVYNETKQFPLALKYYQLAYNLKKAIHSSDLLNSLNNLGDTYFKMDSLSLAEQVFMEFYRLAYQGESVLYHTVAEINLGSILVKEKKPREAIPHLKKALDGCQKYQYKSFEHLVLDDLATAYSQLNRFELAYQNLQRSRHLADSLNDVERQERLNELEHQFDTKLKKEKIDNLQIQETKNQRIILYQRFIIGFSIGIILLIAYLLFIQRKQTKTITKQKDELLSLNQNKDLFFSIIAHDLRGPFSSILGLLDLMVEDQNKLTKSEFERHLKSLEKTANSTYFLLQNLLNWARTQMDNIPMELDKVVVAEIIHEQTRFLQSQITQKSIILHEELIGDICVKGDKDMISFIVRNVISNAIKFTPEKREIKVEGKIQGANGIIEISDQGVGIDQEKLTNLFNIGKGKSTLGTNGEKGTGLGLPLCKAFTEKLGGQFSISSQLNQGTRVSICLPLCKNKNGNSP